MNQETSHMLRDLLFRNETTQNLDLINQAAIISGLVTFFKFPNEIIKEKLQESQGPLE